MEADLITIKPTGTYMNDSLFVMMGFYTGTSTSFQRQLSFGIAEGQFVRYFGTFIEPTQVTETFPFVAPQYTIELGAGEIISVDSVVLYERVAGQTDRLISGTSITLDPRNGYVKINVSPFDNSPCVGCPGLASSIQGIYKADITYTAGYQTGKMVNDPSFTVGLAMASDMMIKQLSDEGLASHDFEGGPVRTLQIGRMILSRDTKHFIESPFGLSNRAKTIANLTKHLVIKRVGKLGR